MAFFTKPPERNECEEEEEEVAEEVEPACGDWCGGGAAPLRGASEGGLFFLLSSSRYTRNLPRMRDGDHGTPSVQRRMPEVSSMNTNRLPDAISCGRSIS